LKRADSVENLTSTPKSDVIAGTLRDRQTDLTLPVAHHFRLGSCDAPGRKLLCPGPGDAIAILRMLFFCVVISLSFNGLAQEKPSEYQVKAAFLFNFAKFVEWPKGAFATTNSPIVLGVLGKNVFGNDLEKTIRDRKVNNRAFQFKTFDSPADVTNCHILFISSSEKDNYPKIISSLHDASTLTVSEADGFLKAGGMINFRIDGVNIRFEISDEAAKKAGLKISSKLLSLSASSQ
jgi:hypothetical protein